MTREEAVARIKDHIEIHRYHERNAVKIFEALDMAIKALKQPELRIEDGGDGMRLIDAEGSELQTQLKIIREAEYQIYGSGSWGFTAKCEHAIEDAPTVQPELHWIPCSEKLPEVKQKVLVQYADGSMATKRCNDAGHLQWFYANAVAWIPAPEPYQPQKEVTE